MGGACPRKAHILYKPHPDVVAGNEIGPGPFLRPAWRECVDSQVLDYRPDQLISTWTSCTMTSLSGFRALGPVKVTTWGQPFYSGWGLTTVPHPRPGASASSPGGTGLSDLVAIHSMSVGRADSG